MKRAFFYLAAAVLTALTFTACEKSEQDEPDVKKPSIEEVLRLDDILYNTGDIVNFNEMKSQYEKMGYTLSSDTRRRLPGDDKLMGFVYFANEQYKCGVLYSLDGEYCVYASYSSVLFSQDMKSTAIEYINKYYGINLQRDYNKNFLAEYDEYYTYLNDDGLAKVQFGFNDKGCVCTTYLR